MGYSVSFSILRYEFCNQPRKRKSIFLILQPRLTGNIHDLAIVDIWASLRDILLIAIVQSAQYHQVF